MEEREYVIERIKLLPKEGLSEVADFPDEERRTWNDVTIVPKIMNGRADDERCNKPWDWFYPPYK